MKTSQKTAVVALCLCSLLSCQNGNFVGQQGPGGGSHETPATTPPERVSLLWEKSRKDGLAWSEFTFDLIENDLALDLLPGADDITDFCPRYHSLDNDKRINVWAMLISAMTKYESGFNPLSRMREATMGTDPVTKLPVHSEGLLQLSYQDIRWAPYCQFDWNADRSLPATSPNKTILQPIKNLNCGMRILAAQVRKKNRIAVKSGAYWSVLIPGGKYTKLNEIQSWTKKVPGCE